MCGVESGGIRRRLGCGLGIFIDIFVLGFVILGIFSVDIKDTGVIKDVLVFTLIISVLIVYYFYEFIKLDFLNILV